MAKSPLVARKVQSRNPEKYEYAYLLFMQRVSQEDICKRVGVSSPTLKSWKDSGGWEQKRASRTISLDDLMQKALVRINAMLDDNTTFSADAFAKAVKQLKELKKKNYDVFINLCEGYLEWNVPSIDVIYFMELLNLPFTGPTSLLYDPPKDLMK